MGDDVPENRKAHEVPSKTLQITGWLTQTSSRMADPGAYASARLSLIDFLGCSISGSDTAQAKLLADKLCAPGDVPALGHPGVKLHPGSAAYLHAWQAHAFEMDDGDWDTWGHLGAPTIAAALSAAWCADATVADLTDAISLAFSFGMALGRAVNPGHYERGFCTTGTIGTLTAAAAAARLLGLNEESTAHALDFAVAQASGVRQFALNGSTSCLVIPANAARAGFEAATLAASGLLGGNQAIEGDLGFLQVFGGEAGELAVPAMPGEHVSRIYFKPHSCCGNAIGPMHSFVEAWQSLGRAELEQIRFELPKEVARNVDHAAPDTELERHLSLQLAVAMHLANGEIGARDLIDLQILSDVQRIMGTVNIAVLEQDQASDLTHDEVGFVSISAADGRTVRRPVPALGPAMGEIEIAKKFKALVEPTLGRDGAERVLSMISNESSSVRNLVNAGQKPATVF